MRKLLQEVPCDAVLENDGQRFVLIQLADGQIQQVDLKMFTEEELATEMSHYNLDAKSMDLHGFIGCGCTDEKVEMGLFVYFADVPIKVIKSYEELEAAKPAHAAHWDMIQKELDDI